MYTSNYCEVEYRENDNVVLVTWKQFCCETDYREPLEYALEIIKEKQCDYVADTRNGFENIAEDTQWVADYFVPKAAAYGCGCIYFIIDKENTLKEELQTQEANSDSIIAFRYIYDLSEVNNKETPTLETDRLILRKIHPEDTEAIFQCWMQDEDVSRYMWWKASDDIKEAKEFVEFELGNLSNSQWNRWIIVEKDSSQIMGTCLIYFNEDENNWDISYNLGKKFWRHGYITEAMKRVMEYAKDELHIKECIAMHAVENPASGRVLEKLGFTYEKEVPYECSGGEFVTTGKYYRWMN